MNWQGEKMKCLKMEDKWINLILSGKKTWIIRKTNTKTRERIALGNKKTKKVEGYAKIADSFEITLQELRKHEDKHYAFHFLDKYAKGRKSLFVWVLKDVEIEFNPKPYTFSTGSWCKTS
jgi:hypothetical protein